MNANYRCVLAIWFAPHWMHWPPIIESLRGLLALTAIASATSPVANTVKLD